MGRLFVIGSLNIDSVISVERHPAPGETVLGGDAAKAWGGKGANQAVAAARTSAGSTEVIFVGRVGDDTHGHAYRERLSGMDIDVSALQATQGTPTGEAVIVVSLDGENTIVVSSGANARLAVDDLPDESQLSPADVLLLTLEVPAPVVVRAAELATASGARFVLNVSPFLDVPDRAILQADPIVVNEHENEQLERRYGVLPSVLVTRGAAGSKWKDHVVPAIASISVVDTTGAGDAYCGALAVRLAAGDDEYAAMQVATAAAADVVGRAGAQ
ncbi:MAG TPA: ribokinase [Glaciihabitans sp.]|jgi:ribokinase|nr:ribokinase [Glaciihabitans sp.]